MKELIYENITINDIVCESTFANLIFPKLTTLVSHLKHKTFQLL